MARSKLHVIPLRRKRKTNYKKRMRLLLAEKPRLVVRRSLKNISIQVIEHNEKGDKVLVAAHSNELIKNGWKHGTGNIPSAYLTGFLAGKKAAAKGIKTAILDIGLNSPIKGTRIYAALKGAVDAGLNVPHSSEILPKDERIKGKHIEDYRKNDITKHFEEIKNKIMGK